MRSAAELFSLRLQMQLRVVAAFAARFVATGNSGRAWVAFAAVTAKLKAAAVFSGGGIKGAALAGALAEARRRPIELVAYGGSSAGAIVALLAALGLEQEVVHELLLSLRADEILPKPTSLAELAHAREDFMELLRRPVWSFLTGRVARLAEQVKRIRVQRGMFERSGLEAKLGSFIRLRFPGIREPERLTFAELKERTGNELRVIGSDIATRTAITFPRDSDDSDLVVQAVAASAAFPVVFMPLVDDARKALFVDGGLATNLPVFLFRDLLENDHIPTFAFDLKPERKSQDFFWGLVDTALGAHDALMCEHLAGVHYCPIRTPSDVNTLDFDLSRERKQALYTTGIDAAAEFFTAFEPLTRLGESEQALQRFLRAMYGEQSVIEHVLSGVACQVEAISHARDVRACIMLPTGRDTRMVVYSFRFNDCADATLELGWGEGVSGLAHSSGDVCWGDMRDPQFTIASQARIPAEVSTLMSLPILGAGGRVMATLNLDTSTPLARTRWREQAIVRILTDWTWVLSGLLRPWRKRQALP